MPRPVLLIREIEQLARRAKWRTSDLAEALGVSRSMLNRLRAGTHTPSREVLGAILHAFGENVQVRELVLHFLEHELPLAHAGRLETTRGRGRSGNTADLQQLDPKAREQVRTFVRDFLRRSMTEGHGLRVVASDPRVLRAAVAYVRTALDAQGIASMVIASNATIRPSERDAAVGVPLLVVERIEFASDAVRALLNARLAVRKPVLLTSATATVVDTALAPALGATVAVSVTPLASSTARAHVTA